MIDRTQLTFLNVEILVCFDLLQHAGHRGPVHVVDQVHIHYGAMRIAINEETRFFLPKMIIKRIKTIAMEQEPLSVDKLPGIKYCQLLLRVNQHVSKKVQYLSCFNNLNNFKNIVIFVLLYFPSQRNFFFTKINKFFDIIQICSTSSSCRSLQHPNGAATKIEGGGSASLLGRD